MAISDKNIIQYTSQDYETALKEIMATKHSLMPEYTDDTDTDFGNLILTYCAMLFDVLSNKLDYSVNEAIPMLSETIKSMYKHCKWIGYKPMSNRASTTIFEIKIKNDGTTQFVTKGSKMTMPYMVNNEWVIFEFDENVDCSPPSDLELDEIYTIRATGTQGESVTEELGESNGKEDQFFFMTFYPYVEDSVEIEVKGDDGRAEFYYVNENNSFVNAKSEDRIIVLEQVDSTLVKVKFGDGFNGRIPEVGKRVIAHYRIGGGLIGNRPAGSINVPMFDMPPNFISITNVTDAINGEDAENVDDIKKTVEKGRHKIIYSLMRYQDYENFLSKSKRERDIDKFKVCKDTIDPIRRFRPIAIYIKPQNSFTLDNNYVKSLLEEMNEYKLIDDEINIYNVDKVDVKIKVYIKSDGLTLESQLKYAVMYAINDYVMSLEIGDDDAVRNEFVGLYADDIIDTIRQVEGVRRFISFDALDTKIPEKRLFSRELYSEGVYDMVLYRGQLFNVANIEEDIIVEFV